MLMLCRNTPQRMLTLIVHASLSLAMNQSCPHITEQSSLCLYKFILTVDDKKTILSKRITLYFNLLK